jgi:uncharacterized Fe-S center protein
VSAIMTLPSFANEENSALRGTVLRMRSHHAAWTRLTEQHSPNYSNVTQFDSVRCWTAARLLGEIGAPVPARVARHAAARQPE